VNFSEVFLPAMKSFYYIKEVPRRISSSLSTISHEVFLRGELLRSLTEVHFSNISKLVKSNHRLDKSTKFISGLAPLLEDPGSAEAKKSTKLSFVQSLRGYHAMSILASKSFLFSEVFHLEITSLSDRNENCTITKKRAPLPAN